MLVSQTQLVKMELARLEDQSFMVTLKHTLDEDNSEFDLRQPSLIIMRSHKIACTKKNKSFLPHGADLEYPKVHAKQFLDLK